MEKKKLAKVAIAHTKEKHRSQERVLALVEAALLELGGISQFVPPGSTVLMDPDLSTSSIRSGRALRATTFFA